MLIPRDYQQACHDHTWSFLHDPANYGKNPLILEPTGTGKSLQMALLIWHLTTVYPHLRIISVAHKQELVEGNYKELLNCWPSAPAGVYSAGLGVKDHRQQITFAGIQSVAKKAPLFGHVDFVLVDEAHIISDAESAQINKFINKLKEKNPNLIVVGYTATGFRMKTGMLVDGDLFDDVAFDLSSGDAFVSLIEQGYLALPVPKNPGFELNSDNIAIRAGEFDTGETSKAMHDQGLLDKAVDLTIRVAEAEGRKKCIIFCQTISDAEEVAEMMTMRGYATKAVHSRMSEDRQTVLDEFSRGELFAVVNVEFLTTGFNERAVDLMVALRLTRSPGLWVQMVGRTTRPVYAPGYDLTTVEGRLAAMAASDKGRTATVLDFCGNTRRLGPINYPTVPSRRKKGGGGGAMTKECPLCSMHNHLSATKCANIEPEPDGCGYEFPPPVRIEGDAGTEKLVDTDAPVKAPPPEREYKIADVHVMSCTLNRGKEIKAGPLKGEFKPDTLRVTYGCGMSNYSEWICFEHPEGSFMRANAVKWWRNHGGQGDAPKTVGEVCEQVDQLQKPKFIRVEVGSKFPRVVGYDFIGTKFQLPPEAGGPPLQEPCPDPLAQFRGGDAAPAPSNTPTTTSMGYDWIADDEIPF